MASRAVSRSRAVRPLVSLAACSDRIVSKPSLPSLRWTPAVVISPLHPEQGRSSFFLFPLCRPLWIGGLRVANKNDGGAAGPGLRQGNGYSVGAAGQMEAPAVVTSSQELDQFLATGDARRRRYGGIVAGRRELPPLVHHGLLQQNGGVWVTDPVIADAFFGCASVFSSHNLFSHEDTRFWDWSSGIDHDLAATLTYYIITSVTSSSASISFAGIQAALAAIGSKAAMLALVGSGAPITSDAARRRRRLDQVLLRSRVVSEISSLSDLNGEVLGIVCRNLDCCFHGPNGCLNVSRMSYSTVCEMDSTSTRCADDVAHLAQCARSGLPKFDFQDYDHDGMLAAPAYKLATVLVEIPVLLVYGGRDELADQADLIRDLLGRTSTCVEVLSSWMAVFRENLNLGGHQGDGESELLSFKNRHESETWLWGSMRLPCNICQDDELDRGGTVPSDMHYSLDRTTAEGVISNLSMEKELLDRYRACAPSPGFDGDSATRRTALHEGESCQGDCATAITGFRSLRAAFCLVLLYSYHVQLVRMQARFSHGATPPPPDPPSFLDSTVETILNLPSAEKTNFTADVNALLHGRGGLNALDFGWRHHKVRYYTRGLGFLALEGAAPITCLSTTWNEVVTCRLCFKAEKRVVRSIQTLVDSRFRLHRDDLHKGRSPGECHRLVWRFVVFYEKEEKEHDERKKMFKPGRLLAFIDEYDKVVPLAILDDDSYKAVVPKLVGAIERVLGV